MVLRKELPKLLQNCVEPRNQVQLYWNDTFQYPKTTLQENEDKQFNKFLSLNFFAYKQDR